MEEILEIVGAFGGVRGEEIASLIHEEMQESIAVKVQTLRQCAGMIQQITMVLGGEAWYEVGGRRILLAPFPLREKDD